MDGTAQDQYIQKKLLYKFQKKLQAVQQEYLRKMYPSSQNPSKMTDNELLEEIEALQFMNFKYRTALLSSNSDIAGNNLELQNQKSLIEKERQEINRLQIELQKAQIQKQNKMKFNEVTSELIKYDKNEQFTAKYSVLKGQIRQLEEKYNNDMKKYDNRQRLLRVAITAMKSFLREIASQAQMVQLKSPGIAPDMDIQDDGQIL